MTGTSFTLLRWLAGVFEFPGAFKVYSALGQEVASLVNGIEEAGNHEVRFDGTRLSSGVYFYRLSADGFVQTKRLLLIR